MTVPSWLPEIINLDGIWEKNLTKLFLIFKEDFITKQPYIGSIPVWHDRNVKDGKYPEGFWHVITRRNNGVRYPDFRRAERLPWCGPSLNNSNDPIIKKWDITEEGELRTYIWLVDYDYVIVLKRRTQRIGEVKFLKTAYHVDGDSTRKKLLAKYANRIV
jgi:hypothetical protein